MNVPMGATLISLEDYKQIRVQKAEIPQACEVSPRQAWGI
jgi:hypothetical protein